MNVVHDCKLNKLKSFINWIVFDPLQDSKPSWDEWRENIQKLSYYMFRGGDDEKEL